MWDMNDITRVRHVRGYVCYIEAPERIYEMIHSANPSLEPVRRGRWLLKWSAKPTSV